VLPAVLGEISIVKRMRKSGIGIEILEKEYKAFARASAAFPVQIALAATTKLGEHARAQFAAFATTTSVFIAPIVLNGIC